jgi:hypothetical protein
MSFALTPLRSNRVKSRKSLFTPHFSPFTAYRFDHVHSRNSMPLWQVRRFLCTPSGIPPSVRPPPKTPSSRSPNPFLFNMPVPLFPHFLTLEEISPPSPATSENSEGYTHTSRPLKFSKCLHAHPTAHLGALLCGLTSSASFHSFVLCSTTPKRATH